MEKRFMIVIVLVSIALALTLPVAWAAQKAGGQGGGSSSKAVLYASVGAELFRYEVGVASADLTLRGSILMPAPVQYSVAHPSSRYFYVASSNASGATGGDKHFLNVFRVDPASGALLPYGQPAALPERPIHVTLDKGGRHALVAFNGSGTVNVYRLMQNGEIGEKIAQPAQPDGGFYAHQVRVSPAGDTVIVVGRGSDPAENKPEDIGSLTIFKYKDGVLSQTDKIIYGPGFGPRHLDFHPSKPWVYVSIERGNKLHVYSLKNGLLSKEPLFIKETVADLTQFRRHRQLTSAIHVHPNGKFVYLSNRFDGTVKDEQSGKMVYAGGENNIAVYKINENTGEPTLIQHTDTRGISPRTFSFDPSGRILVVGNQMFRTMRDGANLGTIPKNLSVFRVGVDGKLEFVRKYDVAGDKDMFWTGIMELKK